jgi:transcriptional regulator with XRE-family HTH domain
VVVLSYEWINEGAQPVTFGEWLKEELDQRGLSMSAFAERIGVSQPAVSNWIAGKRLPDVASAAKIARALDVSINEVYSRVTQEIPVPRQEKDNREQELQRTLDALIVERDELEQVQEQTQQRLEEVANLIEEHGEQLAWLHARKVTGVYLTPSERDLESFVASWGSGSGNEPFRIARMPEEAQIAYAAGFDQGMRRGLKEGLRVRRSQKRKAKPTSGEQQSEPR